MYPITQPGPTGPADLRHDPFMRPFPTTPFPTTPFSPRPHPARVPARTSTRGRTLIISALAAAVLTAGGAGSYFQLLHQHTAPQLTVTTSAHIAPLNPIRSASVPAAGVVGTRHPSIVPAAGTTTTGTGSGATVATGGAASRRVDTATAALTAAQHERDLASEEETTELGAAPRANPAPAAPSAAQQNPNPADQARETAEQNAELGAAPQVDAAAVALAAAQRQADEAREAAQEKAELGAAPQVDAAAVALAAAQRRADETREAAQKNAELGVAPQANAAATAASSA